MGSELECRGTSEGAAWLLLSPSNPRAFLLFLFFSVGQVVNIKAKVNRAFNSSMEVGVCPCPCPPCCVPVAKSPNPPTNSQL